MCEDIPFFMQRQVSKERSMFSQSQLKRTQVSTLLPFAFNVFTVFPCSQFHINPSSCSMVPAVAQG